MNISFGPLDNVSEIGHQVANIIKRKSTNKNEVEKRDEKAKVSNKIMAETIVDTIEPTITNTVQ